MQLMDYCVLAGVSIFFLIGCLIHLYENDIFSMETIKKFRVLIYVLMIETVIDTASVSLYGRENVHFLLYLLKYIEFVLNPTVAFLVFEVFYDKKKGNHDVAIEQLRKIMITAIGVSVVLPAIPYLWGQRIFYIDENNIYQRGNLMVLYVILLVFVILILVYGIAKFSSKTQSIMKQTLFCFTIVLIVGIILKYIFPLNNYDFLCMSVSVIFLLIYYSHTTLRIDPLTKLLNRQVYSRLLERIDYTTIIIMIDVNNLKLINDELGHRSGNQALKYFARAIRKAYEKYAYCFRLGGDEFCVILKPGVFDQLSEESPHCDDYSIADKFITRLDEAILAQNEAYDENENYLKAGAAQGYGIFYSKEDYLEDDKRVPIEKVINLADEMMYHNKQIFKETHPEPEFIRPHNSARAKVLYQPSTLELIDTRNND